MVALGDLNRLLTIKMLESAKLPTLPHGPQPVKDKVVDQMLRHLLAEEHLAHQVAGSLNQGICSSEN